MQRPRTPSRIPESLHQRLNSYALAASAAGVSLVALAQPAETKIIYTRTHHIIDHHDPRYLLSLNHKIPDALFYYHFESTRGLYGRTLFVAAISRNGIATVIERGRNVAVALKPGSMIGNSRNFDSRTATMAEVLFESGSTCGARNAVSCSWGYWFNVTNRYLGLEFKINDRAHFGWARLNVQTANNVFIASVTGYAYETIPNKPIIAGKTKGKDVVTVTEPASLGHLARGASAIPPWRGANSAK
jgi:hypothetical protein